MVMVMLGSVFIDIGIVKNSVSVNYFFGKWEKIGEKVNLFGFSFFYNVFFEDNINFFGNFSYVDNSLMMGMGFGGFISS